MIVVPPNPVPFSQTNWFVNAQAILETCYFIAGIVIAVAAVLGLKQLTVTREIARTNAQREAVKFAAERCQYFADYTAPAQGTFFAEYNHLGLTFLAGSRFEIREGEIVNHNFNEALLRAQIPKVMLPLVQYLNSLEAFAIPFIARVADDSVGFQETALAFCQGVALMMPALFFQRQSRNGRFESTIRLYEIWNKRLQAGSAARAIKPLQELINSVDKERIRPLGTN